MAATVYYRQVLIGGGTTALDEVDGALLADGDPAFVFDGTSFYCYRLNATSGAAESSPDIIAPDTNPGNKRWILQGVQSVENGTAFLSKAVDYTILPADLANSDTLVVLVDASAANRTITLPTPANYANKQIYIIADVDPAGFSVITNKSGGTEWHTGYAKSDFVKVASDGTAESILDEDVTVRGELEKTADQSFALSSTGNGYATNYSVKSDVGGWHDAATNHRIDIGFDCLIETNYMLLYGSDRLYGTINLTGTLQTTTPLASKSFTAPVNLLSVLSTDYIRPDFTNSDSINAIVMYGNAGKTESKFQWNVIRRLR